MSEKQAPCDPYFLVYLNGGYLPSGEAKVSIFDRGFMMGDGVFDSARTFRHQPFRLRDHIQRLGRSLQYLRIDPGLTLDEMEEVTCRVLELNRPRLRPHDDVWLVQRVSRRLNPTTHALLDSRRPTVAIYCELIPFAQFAHLYHVGVPVTVVSTRRTPPQSLESKAKITNYANLIVAEFEAKAAGPENLPILLDLEGHITESKGANVFLVRDGILYTAGLRNILPGITREVVLELARERGLPSVEDNHLTPFDLLMAEEAFLTATSFCILPVRSVNSLPLRGPVPGPITSRLLEGWKRLTGVDIPGQAAAHLRGTGPSPGCGRPSSSGVVR